MIRLLRSALCGLLLFLLAIPAVAQSIPSASQPSDPYANLHIYLLTFGPGDEVWEQFGHNAIEVVDPDRTDEFRDFAANYGVFDFFEKGFYKRFILGQMLYRMDIDTNVPGMLDSYRHGNRSIFRQELNLSPSQKSSLVHFLAWNIRPENCNYHYDYYRDNCSTRVRDALDRCVGGAISAALKPQPTHTTYRWHTDRIMASSLPLYTSLLFILGHPVDRPISAWEESFLPVRFMDHLRHVTILNDAGQSVPIIQSEETLFTANRPPQRQSPPHWLLPFLLLGLACTAVFLNLAYFFLKSKFARITFVLLATLWFTFIGAAGSFAAWGWIFTQHVAVYDNENILHFFPPALLLLVLLPLAAFGWRRCATTARWIALATAALSLFALCIKILPFFHQVNYELIAWVLPTHLAAAAGVWMLTSKIRRKGASPVPSPASNKPTP